MKICGIICEYNPFHNGHAYLLDQAKKYSGCDAAVCIMSGNFTQRGEMAVLDKYTRARHAILAGADAVVELPTVFAVSPAEIFAKGAVRLLASLPAFSCLAFGCETPDKQAFLRAAKNTENESSGFRNTLKKYLKAGASLTRARTQALQKEGDAQTAAFLSSPNNILGTEYVKALLACGSSADILPVGRIGADFSDGNLYKNFSSATAIRLAAAEKKWRAVRKNVPPFVEKDLRNAADPSLFKKLSLYAALKTDAEQLKKIVDCSEGLENRIVAFAKSTSDYDELVAKTTSKRYISSRIRRILTAAALGIGEELVRKSLRGDLYLKVLAIRKDRADEILPELKRSAFPCITRRGDLSSLSKNASETYAADTFAADLYHLAAGIPAAESQMRLIQPLAKKQ